MAGLALAIAAALVATVLVIGTGSDATAPLRSDLESVPGFGVAIDDANRDDTIALYEAWQRETLVAACMNDAGFEYHVEVAFPATAVAEVAARLDVAPSDSRAGTVSGLQPSPNRAYSDGLAPAERDRYFRTLFAESAADFDAVDGEGALPAGRDDFATGGCFGAAWDAVPGVYALKRDLAGDLAEARQAAGSAAITDGACAGTPSEQAMDEAAAAGAPLAEPGAACAAQLAAAAKSARVAAENDVFAAHAARLGQHAAAYSGVMDRIATDAGFQAFLGGVANDLAAEIEHVKARDRDA